MIIKIEHDRCSEFDKYSYYFCPPNLNEDQISEAALQAQQNYLLQIKSQTSKPQFKSLEAKFYPDSTTVAEIKAQHQNYLDQIEKYQSLQKTMHLDFHMEKLGFTPLHDYKGPMIQNVSFAWGHLHGTTLNY